MANNDPTSPEAAFQDADQIVTPPLDFKSRLGNVLSQGDKNSAIAKLVANHNQRQIDEAKMHHQNASTAGGALYYDSMMRQQAEADPAYKAAVAANPDNPPTSYKDWTFFTPEERQTYQTQHDAAMDAYEKIVGVDKKTKQALQQARGIVSHLMKNGHPLGAAGVGAPPTPGGLPAPPAPPSVTPQSLGASQVDNLPLTKEAALTPPPAPPSAGGATPTPLPEQSPEDRAAAYKQFQQQAPFLRQQLAAKLVDARDLQLYKDKNQFLYDLKIKEDAAKAKTKLSAHPPRPAPGQYSTSVLDARTTGNVYTGFDGVPIDLDKLPDTMGLKGTLVYDPDVNDYVLRYTTYSPNQSVITVGKDQFAISPMDKSKLVRGAGQEIGPRDTPTTTRTTDPATGQTTVSTRTPTITGIPGRPGGLATPPAPPNATPQSGAAGISKTTGTVKGVPAAAAAVPLDDSGHIPNTWHGSSPQVIEGANQLKDGMDMKDIGGTSKTKPLSEALARQVFGWSRDKFTPIEHTQIALASRYINEAINSPAIKSLDASFFSQLPMIGASGDPAKEGAFGKALTKLSAMATTPAQAEYLRLYRQMAGTISGLGKLSRGGRITEATVNRLLSELPNPSNTTNSADAIARLGRIKDEVDTALSHDSFDALAKGREGAATPRKGGLPSAPKPGGAASSVDDEIMKLVGASKP